MLMDGVVFPDADKLMNYDPLNVKKIEVVGREYFIGPTIASGIISYTTYKGDLDGFQIDPNAVVLEYEGLQLQREFYAPVYETEAQVSSRMPDFRNLLYWSPSVKTGSLGNKQINFYSSDRQGKYIVVLEGITSSGQAGSKTFTFEVNKPWQEHYDQIRLSGLENSGLMNKIPGIKSGILVKYYPGSHSL